MVKPPHAKLLRAYTTPETSADVLIEAIEKSEKALAESRTKRTAKAERRQRQITNASKASAGDKA